MIDINAEAEKIVSDWDINAILGLRKDDLVAAIKSLCTRYGNEVREEAAKVCDEGAAKSVALANKHMTLFREKCYETDWVLQGKYRSQAEALTDAAAAIRATKEEG